MFNPKSKKQQQQKSLRCFLCTFKLEKLWLIYIISEGWQSVESKTLAFLCAGQVLYLWAVFPASSSRSPNHSSWHIATGFDILLYKYGEGKVLEALEDLLETGFEMLSPKRKPAWTEAEGGRGPGGPPTRRQDSEDTRQGHQLARMVPRSPVYVLAVET